MLNIIKQRFPQDLERYASDLFLALRALRAIRRQKMAGHLW